MSLENWNDVKRWTRISTNDFLAEHTTHGTWLTRHTLKALLEAGADVNLVNRFGVTVLDTTTGEHIYTILFEKMQ